MLQFDMQCQSLCFYLTHTKTMRTKSIIMLQISIGAIPIPDKDPDFQWMWMLRNVMVDDVSMNILRPMLVKRCKLTLGNTISQDDLIPYVNDFLKENHKQTFGKHFRAEIICTLLNYAFRDDDIKFDIESTNNLIVLSDENVGSDAIMINIMLAMVDMQRPFHPYIYQSLRHNIDIEVDNNNPLHMGEELDRDDKLARLYLSEQDSDLEQLINTATIQLRGSKEEAEMIKPFLREAITQSFSQNDLFSNNLIMPKEIALIARRNNVDTIIEQYKSLAHILFQQMTRSRNDFTKLMKKDEKYQTRCAKPVKLFVVDFCKGENRDFAIDSDLCQTDKDTISLFLFQYGQHLHDTRLTPSSTIKERQDILPSMNAALEKWMTIESKSILPFPFMTLFLPLYASNNSVPITIQGFNNRCIDMHRITRAKEGWHSFEETIKGKKQGSFDSKLTVSFFKQVKAVSYL
jgi:hypothetical protein